MKMKTLLGITGIFLALAAIHQGRLGIALVLAVIVFVMAVCELWAATGHSPAGPITPARRRLS